MLASSSSDLGHFCEAMGGLESLGAVHRVVRVILDKHVRSR